MPLRLRSNFTFTMRDVIAQRATEAAQVKVLFLLSISPPTMTPSHS